STKHKKRSMDISGLTVPYNLTTGSMLHVVPEVTYPGLVILFLGSVFGGSATRWSFWQLCCAPSEFRCTSSTTFFVVNLAVSDLLMTLIIEPFGIVSELPLRAGPVHLRGLAVPHRLLLLPAEPGRHRHQPSSPAAPPWPPCAPLWIVSFLLEMPNFPGLGRHAYDWKNITCLWDRLASRSYTIFFGFVAVGLPCCVIVICYTLIFLRIRQVTKNVQKLQQQQQQQSFSSFRLAKTLFLVFAVLVICWTPFTVLVVFDHNNHLPIHLHAYSTFLAHSNSSVKLPGVRPDQRGVPQGATRRLCGDWPPLAILAAAAAGLPRSRTATLRDPLKETMSSSEQQQGSSSLRRRVLLLNLFFGFLAVAGQVGQNVSLPLWIDSGRPDTCGNRSTGNSSAGGELSEDPPLLLEEEEAAAAVGRPRAGELHGRAQHRQLLCVHLRLHQLRLGQTERRFAQLARSSTSIGFFDALNGVLVVFASSGKRTLPALQPILSNFMDPPPDRHLPPGAALRKSPAGRLKGLAALGVFLALVVSLLPTMVPSLGAETEGGAARHRPGALACRLHARLRPRRRTRLLPAAHRARPVLGGTLCPATATPTASGSSVTAGASASSCFFGGDGCPADSGVRGAMFIGMYTVSYIGGGLMLRYAEGATPAGRGVRAGHPAGVPVLDLLPGGLRSSFHIRHLHHLVRARSPLSSHGGRPILA
uniref:G_PROTEIN_RECEP_F1_2 domain-containing protein n=1 Tax=Macrostomum lignano TaxID=282301 RepID=A0A1I8FG45_9PLAT